MVDLKAAITAHPSSAALEAELKTRGGNANAVLNAHREELAAIAKQAREIQENSFSRGDDGKLLPKAIETLNALQRSGGEIQQKMQKVQLETRAGLEKERGVGLANIAAEIAKIITEVNGGRFDIVLDKSAVSRDGLPQVLDWSGAADITEEVIAKMPKDSSAPAP